MPQRSPRQLKAKPISESAVEMTEIALPTHSNALGTLFGGQVMAWIDICAAIAAIRHARGVCVTASLDAMSFISPVHVGEFVLLKASVNFTGKTSMEVGVKVESEEPNTGVRTHVSSAYLTFVALDTHGKPRVIPPVKPVTAEEKRRFRQAQLRRAARLKLKEALA